MTLVKFKTHSLNSKRVTPEFHSGGKAMRAYFDEQFNSPYSTNASRFCWDYWSVPEQYRLLRTPADQFFPKPLFKPFLEDLIHFGRTELGCQMISHPWLSAYIDGSFQNLHSDVPHGPFSFVYSLTNWKQRRFTGGETLVAKPKLLHFFSDFDVNTSHEEQDFFETIEPKFNQLTLFDPRYPHGVKPVHGVESLLESRLVIHGWFTEPRPMIEGALHVKTAVKSLDQIAEAYLNTFSTEEAYGTLALRLSIETSGKVQSIEVIAGHLVYSNGRTLPQTRMKQLLLSPHSISFSEFRFPKSRGKTLVTLPLQIYP